MTWTSAESAQVVHGTWASAVDAADDYFDWVARRIPAVRVASTAAEVHMHLLGSATPAISLRRGSQTPDVARFDVVGGWLVATRAGGEFVFERDAQSVRISLRGFTPRLPPWLYTATHGVVHEAVMAAYQRRRRVPELAAEQATEEAP